jgi:hypothetical protein
MVTKEVIKRKVPEEGHRTLGFHSAGDDTSTAHKKWMTYKAVLYGESITQSTLIRRESGMT